MTQTPKIGMQFYHSHQITKNRSPELCTVTAVRMGMVYYHNSTGFKMMTAIEKFSDSVKEVVTWPIYDLTRVDEWGA